MAVSCTFLYWMFTTSQLRLSTTSNIKQDSSSRLPEDGPKTPSITDCMKMCTHQKQPVVS
jgi:hypothetical protein